MNRSRLMILAQFIWLIAFWGSIQYAISRFAPGEVPFWAVLFWIFLLLATIVTFLGIGIIILIFSSILPEESEEAQAIQEEKRKLGKDDHKDEEEQLHQVREKKRKTTKSEREEKESSAQAPESESVVPPQWKHGEYE